MVNYQNGKIYQIINDVNNKVYIGSTCQSLCRRLGGHRARVKLETSPIYTAMRELGVEHFQIVLVQNAPCDSKEELYAIEYNVMRQFQNQGVLLYNSIIDGHCSDETREKLRIAQTGKKLSEATREKMRGHVMSAEARRKMSESRRGKARSLETRAKIGDAHRKRGCVRFVKSHNYWSFSWPENFKLKCKYLSIKKYGYNAAHGLALFHQEEMFPIEREDDSEFIQEIKNRLNN